MLLLLCLGSIQKTGYQSSLSFECKGMHSQLEHHKKVVVPKYSVKFVHLPETCDGGDLGELFLDPEKFGDKTEGSLKQYYRETFDPSFDDDPKDPEYVKFRKNIQVLFDLMHDKKHDKHGHKSSAYKFSSKKSLLNEEDAKDIRDAFGLDPANPAYSTGRLDVSLKYFRVLCPEGLTIRSRVMDEAVFENDEKIRIIIGPRQHFTPGNPQAFVRAESVDDLNISSNFLVRAGLVNQLSGNKKELELIVVGAESLSEADIRKKVDAILESESYRKDVFRSALQERNMALMGGLGLSAAVHYHWPKFMITARAGIDHVWGKFKQTIHERLDIDHHPSMGLGVSLGAGLDYKCTDKFTIGVEGGIRYSEFKTSHIHNPLKKSSTWFVAPYLQANFTLFLEEDCSISLFSGYLFPKEFTVKSTGTKIPYESGYSIKGIYSGIRFTKYFD